MGPLAASLAHSPELFPLALDLRSDSVSLVRLTRSEYAQASFLDGRVAAPTRAVRVLPFAQLARAVDEAHLPERCDFIFHLGHVGSTLLSRLLGRHPAIFSVREPQILRTLALAGDTSLVESRLPVFLRLLSRTFDSGAHALVKATSFVSELAPVILARPNAPRAIAVTVSAETYLATIFGGTNAPAEARTLAPSRRARLERRLGAPIAPEGSDGEMVAMSWACEAMTLAAAQGAAHERVLVLDFDRFLAAPEAGLARAFAHLGPAVDSQVIAQILAGQEMRTYSKAPEHTYDAALRQAVLDQARREHGDEIRCGLSWLARAAREHPKIARAQATFE